MTLPSTPGRRRPCSAPPRWPSSRPSGLALPAQASTHRQRGRLHRRRGQRRRLQRRAARPGEPQHATCCRPTRPTSGSTTTPSCRPTAAASRCHGPRQRRRDRRGHRGRRTRRRKRLATPDRTRRRPAASSPGRRARLVAGRQDDRCSPASRRTPRPDDISAQHGAVHRPTGGRRPATAVCRTPRTATPPTGAPTAAGSSSRRWCRRGQRPIRSSTATAAAARPSAAVGLMPAWSPGRQTIAYATITSATPTGRARGHRADRDRPGHRRQRHGARTDPADQRAGPVAEYPAWTPDGEQHRLRPVRLHRRPTRSRPATCGRSTATACAPGGCWPPPVTRRSRTCRARRRLRSSAARRRCTSRSTPTRVLDTRPAPNNVGPRNGKLGAGGTVDLQVRGLQTPSGTVPDERDGRRAQRDRRRSHGDAPTCARTRPAAPSRAPATSTPPRPDRPEPRHRHHRRRRRRHPAQLRPARSHVIADMAGYYRRRPPAVRASPPWTRAASWTPATARGAPQAPVGEAQVLDLQVTGSLPTADGRTLTVPADATARRAQRDRDPRQRGHRRPRLPDAGRRQRLPDGQQPQPAAQHDRGQPRHGHRRRGRARSGCATRRARVDLLGRPRRLLLGGARPAASCRSSPLRFLDTRCGVGGAPIPTTAGGFVDLQVAGTRGVPSGATAAVAQPDRRPASARSPTCAPSRPARRRVPTVSNLTSSPVRPAPTRRSSRPAPAAASASATQRASCS